MKKVFMLGVFLAVLVMAAMPTDLTDFKKRYPKAVSVAGAPKGITALQITLPNGADQEYEFNDKGQLKKIVTRYVDVEIDSVNDALKRARETYGNTVYEGTSFLGYAESEEYQWSFDGTSALIYVTIYVTKYNGLQYGAVGQVDYITIITFNRENY